MRKNKKTFFFCNLFAKVQNPAVQFLFFIFFLQFLLASFPILVYLFILFCLLLWFPKGKCWVSMGRALAYTKEPVVATKKEKGMNAVEWLWSGIKLNKKYGNKLLLLLNKYGGFSTLFSFFLFPFLNIFMFDFCLWIFVFFFSKFSFCVSFGSALCFFSWRVKSWSPFLSKNAHLIIYISCFVCNKSCCFVSIVVCVRIKEREREILCFQIFLLFCSVSTAWNWN